MGEPAAKKTKETSEAPSTPPAMTETRGGLATLRDEIDRLFDEFARGWSRWPFGRRASELEPAWRPGTVFGAAVPAVDMVENETAYKITTEMPGIDESGIEVKLADDLLTIQGEKRDETEEKKQNYYLSERRYGAFQRSFRLPPSVDRDKIEASFDKGVLTITLPKSEEARKKEKKIPVATK